MKTSVIKLDLDKAYDRLEWSYINDILQDARLPYNLIKIIMNYVSSGQCKLLWDGVVTDAIKPTRGIRY